MAQNEDSQELRQANEYLKRLQQIRQQKDIRSGRREINGFANLLKPVKREVQKMQRNPVSDWTEVWVNVVGPEISALTKLKGIRNGFLQVEVSNPALRSELEAFYSADLLASLLEAKPDKELRGLKFILAKI